MISEEIHLLCQNILCACGCDMGIVCIPVNLFVSHEKSFCGTHDDCGDLSRSQEELEVKDVGWNLQE